MTQPDPSRPQPVVDAATQAGKLAGGAVLAVGLLVFAVAHGVDSKNLASIANYAAGAVTAVSAAGVWAWSRWKGRKAAAQVTPLSSPQDNRGVPLLPADVHADTYGQHSGQPATGQPAIQEEPTPEYFDTLRQLAGGIHAHPWKKLGKLPPIPGRAAVPFGQFLTAAPAHPIVDVAPPLSYPMYRNDVAGDCVVAGAGHTLQVICTLLGVPWTDWTDAEVLAYYRTQNPNFRSWADADTAADGGMVIQTFLEYLVAKKVILAFGKIDHTNEDEMKAAVYLGLAVITGETLETAQQSQAVWDYKRSGTWGGHCTTTVGYQATPDRQTVVTWGALTDVTQAFITHQLDEAWFVLTQAHVDHPAFRAGFDVAGFAAAVSELTGGKVVVPVPAPQPPPAPAPAPAPAPGPAPTPPLVFPADWDGVTWAKHVLTLKGQSHQTVQVAREIVAAAGQ